MTVLRNPTTSDFPLSHNDLLSINGAVSSIDIRWKPPHIRT